MSGKRGVWSLALCALVVAGCGGDSLVLPSDAEQGVEGRVWLGPQCPVVPADGSCPDLPFSAALDVVTAGGAAVARVRSDEEGRFRIGLRPGRYRIEPRSGDPFPHASSLDVTVELGIWSVAEVFYDTGIR